MKHKCVPFHEKSVLVFRKNYNLSTRALSAGTRMLQFTANGDAVLYSVEFGVR